MFKSKKVLVVGSLLLAAGLAGAHEDVQNEAVKARMIAMKEVGGAMKVLGDMAKGQSAFDAAAADAALGTLAEKAAATPALFEAQEDDPKSEARPAIWENFDDFSAKAMALETAAKGAMGKIAAQGDIGPVMGQLGGTCKGCHQTYRE